MRELEAEAVAFVVGKAVLDSRTIAHPADYPPARRWPLNSGQCFAASRELGGHHQHTANLILSALEPPVEAEDSEPTTAVQPEEVAA